MGREPRKKNKKFREKIRQPDPKVPLDGSQKDAMRDPLDVLSDKFSGMKMGDIRNSKTIDPEVEQERAFEKIVKGIKGLD